MASCAKGDSSGLRRDTWRRQTTRSTRCTGIRHQGRDDARRGLPRDAHAMRRITRPLRIALGWVNDRFGFLDRRWGWLDERRGIRCSHCGAHADYSTNLRTRTFHGSPEGHYHYDLQIRGGRDLTRLQITRFFRCQSCREHTLTVEYR